MRGASEVALRRAEDVLRDALGAGTSAPMRVAEDFFGLADLLHDDARLRRALTDPARSAADKEDLVAAFSHALTPEAVEVVDALVDGHWSDPTDLRRGIELLGVVATLEAAAREDSLPLVEEEIFEVHQFLAEHRQLRNVLSDLGPGTPHGRADLAERIFAPHVSRWTMRLLRRGVGRTEHGRILSTLRRFAERASDLRDRRLVVVESAHPLTSAQVARLRGIMARRLGSDVTLDIAVDPTLLGGIRLVSGSTSVDSTLSAQIAELKRAWVH